VEYSVDSRCRVFKHGKGGRRLYLQTSDWGVGQKVMTVKRSGGKFKINPIGQILAAIKDRGIIYCGSTNRGSEIENGEFNDESINLSRERTKEEDEEMIAWLTGMGSK